MPSDNAHPPKRDGHLVKQDIGAAEISRYDLERLRLRQRLLTHRSENLDIRSPISGLVVSGDLKKSVGVPLSSGDRMFEIAPLDRILVEVAIPEADIRHTAIEQEVEVWLDAFPGDSWTGQVKRIHPRSEIREQEHVFIAEIELENERDRLRPGMRGTGRVSTGLRPAGWILLHRPWEALLMKLGW
jgi:multidrug efflux pump subunit AcrA (membrane-fusion protein)